MSIMKIFFLCIFALFYDSKPVVLNEINEQVVRYDDFFNLEVFPTQFSSTEGLPIIVEVMNSTVPDWVDVSHILTSFVGHTSLRGTVEDIVVVEDLAYVACNYRGLFIYDVSNIFDPKLLGIYNGVGENFRTCDNVQVDSSNHYAFISGEWADVRIIDVSDPRSPTLLYSEAIGAYQYLDLFYEEEEDVLFVAGLYNGVYCLDVSNKTNPNVLWNYPTVEANGVYCDISKSTLFVADEFYGVMILNISNITSLPVLINQIPSNGTGEAIDIYVRDDLLFIAEGYSSFQIVNISNLTNPIRISGLDTQSGYATEIVLDEKGEFAYVSDSGLEIIDVSDPHNPVEVGGIGHWSHFITVPRGEDLIFGVYYYDFYVFNVTDKSNLVELSHRTTGGSNFFVEYLGMNDSVALIASISGLAKVEVPPETMVPEINQDFLTINYLNHFLVKKTGGEETADVVILYLCEEDDGFNIASWNRSSDEVVYFETYIPMGHAKRVIELSHGFVAVSAEYEGVYIVNTTDHQNMNTVSQFGDVDGSCIGMYYFEEFELLYVGCSSSGVYVYNLTFVDNNNPCIWSSGPIDTDDDSHVESVMMAVDDESSVMYIAYGDEGLMVLDIADPYSPSIVQSFKGIQNRVRCVYLFGDYAYVCGDYSGNFVLNVHDRFQPFIIEQWGYDIVGDDPFERGYVSWSTYRIGLDMSFAIATTEEEEQTPTYVFLLENSYGLTSVKLEEIVFSGTPQKIDCGVHKISISIQEVTPPEDMMIIIEDFEISVVGDWLYRGFCDIFFCDGVLANLTDEVCAGRGECMIDFNTSLSDIPSANYTSCTCFESNWNESVFCEVCEEGYFPDIYSYQCLTICNDVISNETSRVCSGHGNCSYSMDEEMGVCECVYNYDGINCEKCYDGFYGLECEVIQCFSVYSNESELDICSGHGDCMYEMIERNAYCTCDEEYFGMECNITTCNSTFTNSSDPNLCSGNGDCLNFELCTCDRGYYTTYCSQLTSCDGILGTNEKVCSGNGNCIYDIDDEMMICDCDEGYVNQGAGSCVLSGSQTDDNGQDDGDGSVVVIVLSVLGSVLGGGLVLGCLTCFVLLLLFLVICVCCCSVFVLFVSIFGGYTYFQRHKLEKFKKLKNFDVLLKEQELEEDDSIAHFEINKKLFTIKFEEIHLKKVIGSGGSNSTVYLAIWKGSKVAFKSFKTRQVFAGDNAFDEFEREVSILSSISHPSILRFIGCCLHSPRIGILMEYCSNGDLRFFIRKYRKKYGGEQQYPFMEKIRMIHEIINAMGYLHSRSIIHRDVKLENILVDSNENCKLMDFGLSKIVERQSQSKTKKVGTSIYLAPEVMLSTTYNEKCDVYSFGIMVFIFLTENYFPYGKNTMHIEIQVAMDREFRPDIKELERVLMEQDEEEDRDLMWLRDVVVSSWDFDASNRMSFSELGELFKKKEIIKYEGGEVKNMMRDRGSDSHHHHRSGGGTKSLGWNNTEDSSNSRSGGTGGGSSRVLSISWGKESDYHGSQKFDVSPEIILNLIKHGKDEKEREVLEAVRSSVVEMEDELIKREEVLGLLEFRSSPVHDDDDDDEEEESLYQKLLSMKSKSTSGGSRNREEVKAPEREVSFVPKSLAIHDDEEEEEEEEEETESEESEEQESTTESSSSDSSSEEEEEESTEESDDGEEQVHVWKEKVEEKDREIQKLRDHVKKLEKEVSDLKST